MLDLGIQFRDVLVKALNKLLVTCNYHHDMLTDVHNEDHDDTDGSRVGGGGDDPVRDETFLSDPSNHTPSMALLEITVAVVEVLQKSPNKEHLLSEVHSRGSLHERFWIAARLQATPTFIELDHYKRLVVVYREDGWSCATSPSAARPTDKTDPFFHLQVFADKASTSTRFGEQISATIAGVILKGGPAALAVTQECNLLEGSLPQDVAKFVRSGRAFDNVEDLALKIQLGRSGSQFWV